MFPRNMKRLAYVFSLLFAAFLLNAPALLKREPVGAADSNSSFFSFVQQAFVDRAQVGIGGLTSVGIQGLAALTLGRRISLKEMFSQVYRMQKYSLNNLTQKDMRLVRIKHDGILIIAKGDAPSLSFVALPEQKTQVICRKSRGVLEVGHRLPNRKETNTTVVFFLTYSENMPAIEASGFSQVFLRKVNQVAPVDISLSADARCVCEQVDTHSMKIRQQGSSVLSFGGLRCESVDLRMQGHTQADLINVTASGKMALDLEGTSRNLTTCLRLHGSAHEVYAIVSNFASLDASWCKSPQVNVRVSRFAEMVGVHASNVLKVDGITSFGDFIRSDAPDFAVEYFGSPEMHNASKVPVRRSAGSSLFTLASSVVTDKANVSQKSRAFLGEVKQGVVDVMSACAALAGLFTGK